MMTQRSRQHTAEFLVWVASEETRPIIAIRGDGEIMMADDFTQADARFAMIELAKSVARCAQEHTP